MVGLSLTNVLSAANVSVLLLPNASRTDSLALVVVGRLLRSPGRSDMIGAGRGERAAQELVEQARAEAVQLVNDDGLLTG